MSVTVPKQQKRTENYRKQPKTLKQQYRKQQKSTKHYSKSVTVPKTTEKYWKNYSNCTKNNRKHYSSCEKNNRNVPKTLQ